MSKYDKLQQKLMDISMPGEESEESLPDQAAPFDANSKQNSKKS
jgi:hypothetical protein